jgi:hypothetical protein
MRDAVHEEAPHDALTSADAPPAHIPARPAPVHAEPEAPQEWQEPERVVETRAVVAPPQVPAVPPVVVPAPLAPVTPPIASAPPVPYALPAESGLELVETDRARAAPRPASEEAETSRPRRVRPPKVELRDEPLEIIETRKEAPPAP